MAANYLSLLMSSVNVTTSDDSDITNTHSTGQVDYLSHEWREEDVWHSWRRMTRHKNEIANGIRLENASWRTWWKQRNHLQTVNPETLNWLKDSDVTWLYGPLHTAEDIRPSLRSSSTIASAQLTRSSTPPPSPTQRPVDHSNPKPILKHRTVTELLISTLPPPGPTTGLVDVTSLDSSSSAPQAQLTTDSSSSTTNRPPLLHTRSETHLHGYSPFRKDSPPRIIASDHDNNNKSCRFDSTEHVKQTPSGSPTPHHHQDNSTKKHIAFNTFVEQCIAIDKPNPYSESATSTTSYYSTQDSSPPSSPVRHGPYEYVHYSPRPSYTQAWRAARDATPDHSDSEEEDDEDDGRIEIKTRSRSSSIVSSRSRPNYLDRDNRSGSSSSNRERVTIASIAPTILKTSSHSHIGSPVPSSVSIGSRTRGSTSCKPHVSERAQSPVEDDESEDGGDVPLRWVPPVGSGYEREFSVTDLDEPAGYEYAGSRLRDVPGGEGRDVRGWIVTPPQDESLHDTDDAPDGRQGRFSRRSEGKRRGRGTRSALLNGSLSPAEVPSSNTDSSESRSRSRHRTNLLPPRSRSRSRSSSIDNRSPDGSGRTISPEVDRQPTERGRPLGRKCDSDSDMHGHGEKALRAAGIVSQRAHTETPPPTSRNGEPGASPYSTSSSRAATNAATTATEDAGASTGIRGYIGSIWS